MKTLKIAVITPGLGVKGMYAEPVFERKVENIPGSEEKLFAVGEIIMDEPHDTTYERLVALDELFNEPRVTDLLMLFFTEGLKTGMKSAVGILAGK